MRPSNGTSAAPLAAAALLAVACTTPLVPADAGMDAASPCQVACGACSVGACDWHCAGTEAACIGAATGCDAVRACLMGPGPVDAGTDTGTDAGPCPAGQVRCGTACADLATDPLNCGMCSNVCGTGVQCRCGQCACPAGSVLYGSCCHDIATDRNNCGACGNTCSAGRNCVAGVCV